MFQSGPTGSHSLPIPAGSRTGDPGLGEGPPRDVPGGEAETVRAVQASVRGAWVRYNSNSNIVIILTAMQRADRVNRIRETLSEALHTRNG